MQHRGYNMGVKDNVRRVKFRLKHGVFTVENVVLMLAIVLCLVWAYQSIAAMSRNWELSERLTTDKKQLELVEIEVETAQLENAYYQTAEYQELLARQLLDKQLPGENMVILPENSAEAKAKHQEQAAEVTQREYTNFEKWMMYLFPNY